MDRNELVTWLLSPQVSCPRTSWPVAPSFMEEVAGLHSQLRLLQQRRGLGGRIGRGLDGFFRRIELGRAARRRRRRRAGDGLRRVGRARGERAGAQLAARRLLRLGRGLLGRLSRRRRRFGGGGGVLAVRFAGRGVRAHEFTCNCSRPKLNVEAREFPRRPKETRRTLC